MIDPVVGGYVAEFEWVYALEAGNIEAVLIWIRTTLVVGVDATFGTEKMLGGTGIKLVKAERVRSLDDLDTVQRYRCHNSAAPSAHRAVTAPQFLQPTRHTEI